MKLEEVNITQITRYTQDKEGKPLKGKYGLYKRVVIKTQEHEDRQISGFARINGDPTDSWEVGSRVSIYITEKDGYLNFSLPRREDVKLDRIIEMLEEVLDRINERWPK